MSHYSNPCNRSNSIITNDIIDKITKVCNGILANNKDFQLADEYDYGHLVLCVIDSVFSIGVRYQSVKNTINHFCDYYKIEKFPKNEELTNSHILKLMDLYTTDELTEKIFQNKQRTSTKNGIRKSEAVLMFLRVLIKYKVESFKDLDKIITNDKFENEIREIPGQKSGISLKYFFMLAGSEDLIKPDRMIIRFLEHESGKKLSLNDCQLVLTEVSKNLNEMGFKITPKKLDNLIWNYQRTQK
jgi:hypothetical protein